MNFLVLIVFVALSSGATSINITSVRIPPVVRANSSEPVILDCVYEFGNSPANGLVIKWYVNTDVLYQWILGHPPSIADEYTKYIDPTHRASNDPLTMYRALKLVRPPVELTGDVKCQVSTYKAEAEAIRPMIVYSPARNLRILPPSLNKTTNSLTVTCLADGLYPEPVIVIHADRKPIETTERVFSNSHNNLYSARATIILEANKVILPTVFRCKVYIREVNYESSHEYVYNGSHVPCISLLLLALNLILCKRY